MNSNLICAVIAMYFCCWFSKHLVSKKKYCSGTGIKIKVSKLASIKKKNGMIPIPGPSSSSDNSVQKGASYMLKVGSSSSNI